MYASQTLSSNSYNFSLVKRGLDKLLIVKSNDHLKVEEITLMHISLSELKQLRKSTIPCFILKHGDSFYYTSINREYRLTPDSLSTGLTAVSIYTLKHNYNLVEKKHLEDFDWLVDGFETFNTSYDEVYVSKRKISEEKVEKKLVREIKNDGLYSSTILYTYMTSRYIILKNGMWKKQVGVKDKKILTVDVISSKKVLDLREITLAELQKFRSSEVPGFVLKSNNNYYYSDAINSSLREFGFSNHKCATSNGTVCHRLSAALDEEGGCAKVRGFSTHIENFPFITYGYETFNTKNDVFIVLNCYHFIEGSKD